uniref:Acylglycerol kinase C-terminal domain-containing protein n=1 Tax=Meleagris gallopavo TaxID=9103 RepID=G1NKL7_MELGA
KLLRKPSFLPTRKPPQFIEGICCQIERNLLPPSALCCVLGTYGKHLPPHLQLERQQPTSVSVLLSPKPVTSGLSLWQHKMGDVLRTLGIILKHIPSAFLFVFLLSCLFCRHITNATLAILKGETVPLDVLQIKGEKEQPVFALSGLRWGSYRDAGVKASKYWYLGPLKTKAAHFFSMLKEWPQKHQAALMYLGPTERPPEEPEEKQSRPPLYVRLYRRLRLYWSPPRKGEVCEVAPEDWQELKLSTVELSIATQNRQLDLTRTEDFMNICIEADTVSKGQFVNRGSQKMRDPHMCPEGSQCIQASRCILQLPEGTEGSFGIDNEEYEAMPVEVKLLPRKLRFFCDPRMREQMLRAAVQ